MQEPENRSPTMVAPPERRFPVGMLLVGLLGAVVITAFCGVMTFCMLTLPGPALLRTEATATPVLVSRWTPTVTYTRVARTPTAVPTATSAPTPLPTVIVEAEWPKKMEIDRSDSVRVSLVQTTEQVYIPIIEIPGHEVLVDTPMPVGTPEAPMMRAFGPEYESLAVANFAGSAFDVTALTTEYQSLEQPRINWEWNITPNERGRQVVNVKIEVEWRPVGSSAPAIRREIWRERLEIDVEKPLIRTVHLNIFGLANGLLGSALSVPFLYDRIKERREKRRKDKRKRSEE